MGYIPNFKLSRNSLMLKKRYNQVQSLFIQSEFFYDRVCAWMTENHVAHQTTPHRFVTAHASCTHQTLLTYVKPNFDLGHGWHYVTYEDYPCDLVPSLYQYQDNAPAHRTGALRYTFRHENGQEAHVLLVATLFHDADLNPVLRPVATMPEYLVLPWLAFEKECRRIDNSAIQYRGKVYVIGGQENSFDTAVQWDEIYLPDDLKSDIMNDVDAFFERGVSIYQRLNIKPFRKLLLAGVPGTGKTMICSALAHWALARDFFVVYVSGSNTYGARFWKIHQALEMAASSESRAIVIVEELDAYLQEEEAKAELLNVLDGLESPVNTLGTILIATTNHPEKIDDRVLKRPGRLDRVFIIPEMEDQNNAETMLRKYMGDMWQDSHKEIVPSLLGKPGAFIREVALYALTMAAYRNEANVPLELLQASLEKLQVQMDAKDDFLTAHKRGGFGFSGVQPLVRKRTPRD